MGGVIDQVTRGTGKRRQRSLVAMLGFWTAVTLPFIQVGMLAYGLTTLEMTLLFVALLAANLVALLVGHGYEP
ncbi:hypothetical protein [Haloarchaeobius sp. TZWWS8]|uniref:hypothetical protein n=1 Tax=Haloarchaeobius sp. TZWWS8 TaxID=3446121 RepID=UPI003EBCC8D7